MGTTSERPFPPPSRRDAERARSPLHESPRLGASAVGSKNQNGGALLAVLWLSAALAAIAFSLATSVRGEVERASTAVDGLRSYYLASGAIQRTILYMLWGPQDPQHYWMPGTPVLNLSFPEGEVAVEVIPEASKLNVNQAPPEDLFRLLVNLGVGPERAREITLGIVDWRTPSGGPGGMFDMYYLSISPTFLPHHASLEEIEELLLIKGMTPDIFYGTYEPEPGGQQRLVPRGGLNDCLSVFGSVGQIDANTARPAVLATLGLSPEAVAAVVERRRLMPFQSQEQLMAFVRGAGPGAARLRVGGNSIYTVRATARLRLSNGQLSDLRRSVAALVKLMPAGYDAPYHILRWYDTAWSH